MNVFKKWFAGIMIAGIGVFSMPHLTHAQTFFGGLDVADYTSLCDCSGAIYSVFTPLFINGAETIGALTWYTGQFQYPNYTLRPGAWALGTFIPGIPVCWKVYGYFCVPVYAMGHILPETGTSP